MDIEALEALSVRLQLLARLEEPSRVASLSTEVLETLRKLQMEISATRDSALVDLHGRGNSLHEIARVAGLTRGRVFQIVQRGRAETASQSQDPLDGPTPA